MTSKLILLTTVLAAGVTWLPRVFPFFLVKYRQLPNVVVRFLKYLPISIIFALLISSLMETQVWSLPRIRWAELVVTVVSLFIALRYKHILLTVLVGVVGMALLRFFF